jgi:acetoin utilization protein AcuB
MHPDPATMAPTESLASAFATMRRLEIRHLPVVDDGAVVGIVTDRDLRLATSALAEAQRAPGDPVAAVMSRPVQTAAPRDPVEHAARTMRELKIGCLPVLEGKALVGIVTGIDLLDTLLMMTGVHRPSARLEVRLCDEPGRLAELARVLAERQINIHSILSHPAPEGGIRLVLRVGAMDPRPLIEALSRTGIEVVWPPHHRCQ